MVCIVLESCAPVDLGHIKNPTELTIAELIEGSIRSSNEFALRIDVSRILGLSSGNMTLGIDEHVPDDVPDILIVTYHAEEGKMVIDPMQGELGEQLVSLQSLNIPERMTCLFNMCNSLQLEFDAIGTDIDSYYQTCPTGPVPSGNIITAPTAATPTTTKCIDALDDVSLLKYTFEACSLGDVNTLECLLAKYGNERIVSLCNVTAFTPLHHACFNGQYDVCSVLLRHGANVAATAHMQMTPLHVAVAGGHIKIVTLLLDNDADPFASDMMGHTALDKARMGNHYSIVDMIGKREST